MQRALVWQFFWRYFMGTYLNPGNDMFAETVRGEIYVDKTGLSE